MASDSQKKTSEEKQQEADAKEEQKSVEAEQKKLDKQEKETQKQADDSDTPKQSGAGVAGENAAKPSKTAVDDLPNPKDDNYDPYQDPSVPSSPIADNVRAELAGKGKSPTLDACRKAFKDEKSQ